MKIELKQGSLRSVRSELIVLAARGISSESKKRSGGPKILRTLDDASNAEIIDVDDLSDSVLVGAMTRAEFCAKPNSKLNVPLLLGNSRAPQTVRLFGQSDASASLEEGGLDEWRRLGADAVKSARQLKAKSVSISLRAAPAKHLAAITQALCEGAHLARYTFDRYKKKDAKKSSPEFPSSVQLLTRQTAKPELKRAVKTGATLAQAVSLTRDLVNCPPSDLTPADLIREARRIATKSPRIRMRVMKKAALQKMGANALLAVARGSAVEPCLIHMTFKPAKLKKGAKNVVLVGKGVTFDSGGLSLKSGRGMETMKCDMAGAGCVLGIMRALADLPSREAPQHCIHALIPAVENLVDAKSVKPGDVVRAINGKTIEILNTDAEGRLILADALCYSERLKPDLILDLATLTGACVAAIGKYYAGLFSSDDELVGDIASHGKRQGENYWRLPLADDYRKFIDSKVANIQNIGSGGPGATTAALFLREFVPEGPLWAHIDIAGPAFDGGNNEYTAKGGTGFGVRTLLSYLKTLDA